jgi:DNA-binding Lrp family transcriptional regulator
MKGEKLMERDSFSLDSLDKRIILELRRDGRASYRDVAKKLNVSDGAIRFRVNRMIEKRVLRISALIDPFSQEGYINALIGMQLERRTQRETMREIAKLKDVLSVCNSTGEYDLFVEVLLESREALNRFLFEDLSRIDGIKSTETFVFLDALNKWVELR